MSAMRIRFNADELTELFRNNVIEIRHGSHWRRARVNSGEIHVDPNGYQYCDCTDISPTTRTAGHGQLIRAYSKQMRPVD